MTEPRRWTIWEHMPDGSLAEVEVMAVEEHEAELAAAKQAAVHHQIGVSTPVTFNVLPGLRQTLREHHLAEDINYWRGRDDPYRWICSCALDLGWHPSVDAAVDAWIDHVAQVQDPKRREREAKLARLRAIEQAARVEVDIAEVFLDKLGGMVHKRLIYVAETETGYERARDALRAALAAQDETGGSE